MGLGARGEPAPRSWRSPCGPTSRAIERFRVLDLTLDRRRARVPRAAGADADRAAFASIDPHAIAVRTALWLPPVADARPISPGFRSASRRTTRSRRPASCCRRSSCSGRAGVCANEGGTGRLVRAIAFIGLIASVAAIVQRAQRIDLLYGVWRPLDTGARPYGPFVNRNHMATWIIMACPLAFGYLLARAPRRDTPRRFSQRVVNALKQLGTMRIWLVVAVCVMTLAVLLSASRSGLIGLMSAFVLSTVLTRRARHARRAPLGDLSVRAARARRAVVRQLRRAAAAARRIDDARAGRTRPRRDLARHDPARRGFPGDRHRRRHLRQGHQRLPDGGTRLCYRPSSQPLPAIDG